MDDHQIKALQKVLSCAEEAYEKFRPAIGQRLVGIEGSTGDRVCPDLSLWMFRLVEAFSLFQEAIEIAFQAGYGRKSNEEEYLEIVNVIGREPTVQEALLLHEAHKEGFQKKTREKLARTFPIA